MLSKRFDFEVESVEFDSTEFQFWGSEQCMKDIPFYAAESYVNGIDSSIFSENDINSFKIQAEELNLNKEGDQACFLLRKMTC